MTGPSAPAVGFSSSADSPVTAGAFQERYAGGTVGAWRDTGDHFAAVLSADGSRAEAATLTGGGARDWSAQSHGTSAAPA